MSNVEKKCLVYEMDAADEVALLNDQNGASKWTRVQRSVQKTNDSLYAFMFENKTSSLVKFVLMLLFIHSFGYCSFMIVKHLYELSNYDTWTSARLVDFCKNNLNRMFYFNNEATVKS